MALEAHVILDKPDGTEEVTAFHRLGEALAHLNAASFAGIPGVVVVSVGKTQSDAYERVAEFTGRDATEGDSATE